MVLVPDVSTWSSSHTDKSTVSIGGMPSFMPTHCPRPKPAPPDRSAHVRRFSLRADLTTDDDIPDTFLSRLLFDPKFETLCGCVVLGNFIIMTMETHATATDDDTSLLVVTYANRFFLLYYTVECVARMWVLRRKFFAAAWNNLDFVIVFVGWASEVLEIFKVTGGMNQISMLKSLRMLRLLRLLRLFVAFRELYVLVAGIGRCMKTLFWASGLIFIVLNVWAILSVEFLHDKIQELVPTGAFSTCGWCSTAFSNIWYANLTWFQIISTSDWSALGRPLAEEFYWPYAFFVFNVFIVIWGLLNLIVAAIVDANIAAREEDVAIGAKIADQVYTNAWSSFEAMCRDMDADGSGDVSVKEFKDFLEQNVQLQQHLQIMGIHGRDVDDLLKLMDEDGNGLLEFDEFIEQFTAMRTLVERTSLFFLLRYCHSIKGTLSHLGKMMNHMRSDIAILKGSNKNAASLKQSHSNTFDSSLPLGRFQTLSFNPRANRSSQDFSNVNSTLTRKSTITVDETSLAKNNSQPKKVQLPSQEYVATPGKLRSTAQTLRTADQPEMPCVELKRLPPGWYYIGASMPSEASVWCKAEDATGKAEDTNGEAKCTSSFGANGVFSTGGNFIAPWLDMTGSKEVQLIPEDQSWEPLISNAAPVHHARHVYVKAPCGEIELSPEIAHALASIDKFIDTVNGDHVPNETPVSTDRQRPIFLPSNSIRVNHAKHVYLRAPIGDVQFPPRIIDALASVDQFVDGACSERSLASHDVAIEFDSACEALNVRCLTLKGA